MTKFVDKRTILLDGATLSEAKAEFRRGSVGKLIFSYCHKLPCNLFGQTCLFQVELAVITHFATDVKCMP